MGESYVPQWKMRLYRLRDPRTGHIRYIGQTLGPLRERLTNHISAARAPSAVAGPPVARWVRGLDEQGLRPVIELIDTVPYEVADEQEEEQIRAHSAQGCALLNVRRMPRRRITEDGMTTEKAVVPMVRPDALALPSPQEWQTLTQLAEALFKSGLLPAHIKSVQAALAIMVKGRELGIPAMQALGNIAVVNGKPTCNAELMLALTYRDHGDDALHIEETTAERCVVSYKRRAWTERRTHTFTMADAQRAGLAGSQTWQKYPQALLRARCISAVARMAFPDSIAGMFGYEEMGAAVAVEDDGAVVLDQAALPSAPTPDRPAPAGVRVAPPPNGPASGGQTTLDRVAGEFAAAPADGQPPGRSVSVEEAKAALKEVCLRIGLPAPVTLREVNTLARERGVDVVGSSAGVTAPWLDRIRAALPDIPVGPLDREHMSDKANALTALRATCKALGRPDGEPGSLDALNALATEAGLGIVASWDTVAAGWLEAIRRHLSARPGTTEAAAQRHTTQTQGARTEQSLAGWIAAAPDRATLEQLSSDVHRAHEVGAVSQGVAEALLEAVDARTAELDLYGAGAAAAGEQGAASASAEQSGAQGVEARAAG